MTILHFDGFGTYATADLSKEYTLEGAPAISATGGRRGGGALQAPVSGSSNSDVIKSLQGNYSTIISGFSFKYTMSTAATCRVVAYTDGGSYQCGLAVNGSGQLIVYRSSVTTVLGTSSIALTSGAENYIEFKATISDAAGSFEVRVNGASVLSVSGVDTKATVNAYANAVVLGMSNVPGAIVSMTFDDFYLSDTSGSAPYNDFLGDIRVDAVYPNGDGNYSQLTPSTGTTHYNLVNEATPDAATYVSSSVAGQKDSYTMQNPVLNSSTIFAVRAKAAALKDDAGARALKVGVRSGTTDSVSAAQALSTVQLYYSNILQTDPNTGVAWTQSGLDNMEVLVEVA